MRENVVREKSFKFAVRIVNLNKFLQENKKEYIISKQILRSGTSIGASVRESEYAESKADFIHKLAIAQKECNETLYWLELLRETEYVTKSEVQDLHQEATEIIKLITSSIKTAKIHKLKERG